MHSCAPPPPLHRPFFRSFVGQSPQLSIVGSPFILPTARIESREFTTLLRGAKLSARGCENTVSCDCLVTFTPKLSVTVHGRSDITSVTLYHHYCDLLQLRLVVLEHLLEEVDALLRPDLVHPHEVLGRGELQVLPLLVQLVRDLAGRDLGAVQTCSRNRRTA